MLYPGAPSGRRPHHGPAIVTPLQAAAYAVPVPWNGTPPDIVRPTKRCPIVVSVLQTPAGRWVWHAQAEAHGPNARALVVAALEGVGAKETLDADAVELAAGMRDAHQVYGTGGWCYLAAAEVAGLPGRAAVARP